MLARLVRRKFYFSKSSARNSATCFSCTLSLNSSIKVKKPEAELLDHVNYFFDANKKNCVLSFDVKKLDHD